MVETDSLDLFNKKSSQEAERKHKPLAMRMRPSQLSEVVGQRHLLGEEALLPRLINGNLFGSILFYGPPGCGKTTLAEVIAAQTNAHFVRLNAVLSNVAEVREVLKMARYREETTLLFIDEIHRFNKAQQDLLLPDIEAGNIRLIGATTHNPGFYIIKPLLSRSHLFRLEPLDQDAVVIMLKRALSDTSHGLGAYKCEASESVLTELARISQGDMRWALGALETLVLSLPMGAELGEDALEAFAEERQIRYDRDEEEHYDTISAYIKSIRGCDPDASLYWLAKMLEGGEDPRFIARRLVILASEDVGVADPRALPLATAAFQACEFVGMPECAINLGHVTVALACAPKSNASYLGLLAAQDAVKRGQTQAVPMHLRDKGGVGRSVGNGAGYRYSHDYGDNVSGQAYMNEPMEFYEPKDAGYEASVKERLQYLKDLRVKRSKS